MVKIPPTVSDMDIVLDKEKRKLVQKTKKTTRNWYKKTESKGIKRIF